MKNFTRYFLAVGFFMLLSYFVKAQKIQPSAIKQIESLQQEKELRTPAQKKIDSQLWYALKQEKGLPITNEVPSLKLNVTTTAAGKVQVEITGNITPALLSAITNAGGEIVSSHPNFNNVCAQIPLLTLEQIAALSDVKFIAQWLAPKLVDKKKEKTLNEGNLSKSATFSPAKLNEPSFEQRKANLKKQLLKALSNKYFIGSVTSQGDVTHKAALARTTFNVNGAGIKIGILSDSYNSTGGAAANVASGDLPGVGNPNGFTTPVTVLNDIAGGTDEGRAMLNIVHDLAPGAQLYFATAYNTQADFAQHILDLRAAGCDIICDDVFYFTEGVFQDGVVAQAVNTVTASGALYFSSAGNQGNKNDNTSTVWEGDFVDGGAIALLTGGTVNDFGGATLSNQILSNGGRLKLTWADPLGASTNDYDIYVLNSTLTTVVASGTNVQSGTQDPMEIITGQAAGNRVVIFKKTGAAARALHLNGFNGGTNGFTFTTQGQTSGHSSAAGAFSVAATPAAAAGCSGFTAGPATSPFTAANKVECFSSDGPRRVFLNANGTAITPGNFLFATNGGTVRQKPDITAADGVVNAAAGFNPFYGTSAAAPHAAAIAALLKQNNPNATTAQLRNMLTSTAIDIEAAGTDRNSGAGIVMAWEALNVSCQPAINTQPSSTTVCTGNVTSFTIVALGAAPITYQWQLSIDNGVTWNNIVGATATTYSLTAVTADNGKQFRCIATGTCGSATSNPAILTITTASVGGTLSPATASVCGVSSATGTLTLTGLSGNVIRWEQSINGGTTWTNIANTTTTLNYNVSITTQFRVLVQGGGCASSAYSTISTISIVAGLPINIVADPGTTLCAGDPTKLTVQTVPQVPATATMTQTLTSANSVITFNFRNNNAFPVTITNLSSILNFTGGTATVSAYYKASAIAGAPGAITTANGWNQFGGPTSMPSVGGVLMPLLSGLSLVVPAGATYGIAVNSVSTGGTANIVYSNALSQSIASAGGCDIITGAGIGYSGAPVPAAPTTTPRYFIGSITFSAPGTTLTTGTFAWTPTTGISPTNANPVAASPTTTTTYSVTTNDGAGCVRNASILITVNTRPTVTTQPVNTTVCANGIATFTAAGTGTNFTYQWQESTNGGTTWTNITNGGIYSGVTTGTLTLTGVTAAMNNYQYRLVVSGTCPPVANSSAATLTVTGLPTIAVTPTGVNCGGVAGINGIALTASGANTYTWSPIAGLYTDATATTAYVAGANAATVYAAPTALTTYTVAGTNTTTGCTGTATTTVNYTPPAPTITPASVAMCLGDNAVRLSTASVLPNTISVSSGTINIPIADASPTGTPASTITVAGVPTGAIITKIAVKLNVTHTYIGDMTFNLKAPNGNILNLDRNLTATGNGGANFTNTIISSSGTTQLKSGSAPFTSTFKADAINGAITPGYTYSDPTGYIANATSFADLYSVPNGNWTLASADDGAGDVGVIKDWSLDITYNALSPVKSTWSPIAGLYTDAGATTAYTTGTLKDTVYTKPTPAGTYTYKATINSLPPASVTPSMSNAAAVYFTTLTFNVRNNNPYPVTLTDIISECNVTGATNVSAYYKTSAINGLPGAITAANGWNQFGSATITSLGYPNLQSFMSGLSLTIPAGATYGILVSAALTDGTPNLLFASVGSNLIASAGGCDIITGTNIGYSGAAVPAAPTFTPYYFIGSVTLAPQVTACTSPAQSVVVTVNQPVSITTQPVAATICTDKTISFSVAATGTGLSYQWQVSTDGTTYNNVTNGTVYSGATTNTLTLTAPPVSMSGYLYHCIVSGTCGSKTTDSVKLTVNPLPVIVIAGLPLKLFPGLRTTLTSTVSPNAAATYTWWKNGAAVSGATASSYVVDVDHLGAYTLQVTDVNGCTSTSNTITITDSANGRVFIAPNPSSGIFHVRYWSALNNSNIPRGINAYDARGKRLFSKNYAINAPYASMDVDLSNQSTGVYWLELVDVNGNRLAIGRAEVVR